LNNEAGGLTAEQFAILVAPFAPEEHYFLRGFIYLKETPICQRIEDVDLGWEWRVEEIGRFDGKDAMANCVGHLTICGVTRSGVGGQAVLLDKNDTEIGEVEKGAETDALKRAARKFGIGRYMLECPKNVKGYGNELNTWLSQVEARQDWSPQLFEKRCLNVLGLARGDLVKAAQTTDGWKALTYREKFWRLSRPQ